ncbi:murein DD-endopeptidase MepM/ murein hydrolase activator NlpD [Catalinimonas alkaloidigena]|uniref:peptidoglycan DD-metalloendopeptidase family protein n=1 Tax=Catalinimonas alkaloidigena TaxID=1075417 RepID=UPI002404B320|nr:peptidoglycan DD-metalloendopeptidase family protein [Catalinimonas alkaloidigena]MDF9800632.1 murein DD-endopeptidase MepM/ murein hydrolase activator NlpD [Catalinimonas alkaloidigena]
MKSNLSLTKLSALIIPIVVVIAIYQLFSSHPEYSSPQVASQVIDSLQNDTLEAIPPPEPKMLFGLNVDSLQVVEATVEPNQFLSQILTQYNVSLGLIDKLAKASREVFDVRKIRANRNYTVLCSNDSLNTARYFIYEPSRVDFVVYELSDSIRISTGQHPVDTVTQTFAGVIDYSIYQTLSDADAPTELVNELSEVYAWQIDLFKVQKGDKFKMIYEEVQIKGERVGVGRIKAAQFERGEEEFYAFYYDQGGKEDYFDEKGNSLRKAFLKAPLKYSRISSRFSHSRLHPVLKIRRPHHGIDYAAPRGTPVRAVGDGMITKANYSGGAGNYVKIRHNNTYTTGYMHLSKYGKDIRVGKYVKQGDIIGYVGSTGISTGPHLDYRVWKDGKAVDALKIEMPPSEPISEEHRETYEAHMKGLMEQLFEVPYPERQFILANAKTSLKVVNVDERLL